VAETVQKMAPKMVQKAELQNDGSLEAKWRHNWDESGSRVFAYVRRDESETSEFWFGLLSLVVCKYTPKKNLGFLCNGYVFKGILSFFEVPLLVQQCRL
jgi:hypothetical protein